MERSTVALILLYISAVSVSFGQPVPLNRAEGGNVTFDTAVRNMQILLYNGDVIGDVTDGKVKPTRIERFRGRVQWDSSTEFFSITDLMLDDSGKYKVQSDDGRAVSEFQLTVHTPVSKPDITQEEDLCTLRCSVERGTGVTLSWRRGDGQVLKSPLSQSAPASQLLKVTEGTYICEAKNPISTETDSITVGKNCKKIVAVSKPTIRKEGGSCSFLCTVHRGTDVTLSWYRNGLRESLPRAFFPNGPVSLDMTVNKGGNYTCEAKNPGSTETASVTVGDECAGGSTWVIVGIAGALLGALLLAVTGVVLYRRRQQLNNGKKCKQEESG